MNNGYSSSIIDIEYSENRIEAMKYLVNEMDKYNKLLGNKIITGILSHNGVIFATHQAQKLPK